MTLAPRAQLRWPGPLLRIRRCVILSWRKNCLGGLGAAALARALAVSSSALTALSLDQNQISDGGAAALAAALAANTALATLDLDDNLIGDAGAAALAEALASNRGLAALHLARNSIGDVGAAALAGSFGA